MTYEIEFEGCDSRLALAEPTDAEIDRARAEAEERLGRKLEDDDRTGFPSFSVYEEGEWIAGG